MLILLDLGFFNGVVDFILEVDLRIVWSLENILD